ncbi:MAG TPA: HWE histidine kinase domain-containing protein [Caulobacteraceae bacterium]|nr:HWE histidine kinase domain-containing protein [Caulobacteraceae bacterium]
MSDASPTTDRYRALFHAIDAGFCIIEVRFDADDRSLDYRFIEVNPAFEVQTGLKDAAGRWMRELRPDHEQRWFDLYGHVALTGEATRFENFAAALGRWYEVHVYRIGEPADRQVAILFSDISERRRVELALRESEARFRAMADTAPAPVWVTTAEGPVEFVNAAFAELIGKPREELLGDAWIGLVHPDDLPDVAAKRQAARATLEPYVFEARFLSLSGWRIMQANSRPRFDDDGQFAGYVGLAVDVTDIRNAEARQRLLINELNHRVKNTLAAVQSLAHQTVRDGATVQEARRRLTERLLALSAAHNVLTRESWEGAELSEIIEETLRPYDALGPVLGSSRIRVEGEDVRLAPNAALAFSMALHELATNAAKYGALSAAGGEVIIRYATRGGGVELTWEERGGPPVEKPASVGFGLRLLERGLATELGSSAVVEFRPEGVVCTLQAQRGAALAPDLSAAS